MGLVIVLNSIRLEPFLGNKVDAVKKETSLFFEILKFSSNDHK